MNRCLDPKTPSEKAFRGSKHLLTRYLEDFGRIGHSEIQYSFSYKFWFSRKWWGIWKVGGRITIGDRPIFLWTIILTRRVVHQEFGKFGAILRKLPSAQREWIKRTKRELPLLEVAFPRKKELSNSYHYHPKNVQNKTTRQWYNVSLYFVFPSQQPTKKDLKRYLKVKGLTKMHKNF